MKRKGIYISIIIIGIIGIMLWVGVRLSEKQDTVEHEKIMKDISKNTKNAKDESAETGVKIQRKEKNKEENSSVEEMVEEKVASLLFAGDVYLSGYVRNNYEASGITEVVDESLLSQMQDADLFMVNQEFPFGTGGTPMEEKEYTFRVNPSYVSILKDMGVDIVSLANNHVLDYGRDVLQENFQVLDANEIFYAGAGMSVEEASALRTIEAEGETYGVLSASRVIPVTDWDVRNAQPGVFTTYDETALVKEITEAKERCDFLTVYVHWGIERNTIPEDYQKQLAHAYIDAGADLVIGAHPHVLQGIEAYNGKLIFYSLGNFIFNQSIDKTMLVKAEIRENGVSYSMLPAYAKGAKTLEYEDKESFYAYLESLSEGIFIENGNIMIEK